MTSEKSTGRKPGHNVKKGTKGFISTPPVKPIIPTPQDSRIVFPSSAEDDSIKDLAEVLAVFSPGVVIGGIKVGCDKCGVRTEETFTSIKEATKEVTALGWTIKEKEFFCPSCSDKGANGIDVNEVKDVPDYRVSSSWENSREQYKMKLAANLRDCLENFRAWLLTHPNGSASFGAIDKDFRETIKMYDEDFRAVITLGLVTGQLDYTLGGDGIEWIDDPSSANTVQEQSEYFAASAADVMHNKRK